MSSSAVKVLHNILGFLWVPLLAYLGLGGSAASKSDEADTPSKPTAEKIVKAEPEAPPVVR